MEQYVSVVRKLEVMGFRQREIALILDISQPTVSNIVNGKYDSEKTAERQMSLFKGE